MAESKKQDISLPFPVKGVQEVGPHSAQPPQSTHESKNVVPFDSQEGRLRGGRRRGIGNLSAGLGGKIQLLDDMKVPKSNYQGFSGGTVYYSSGLNDGVTENITSNLSNILRDPNQDNDTDDSMEDKGGIAYRGPNNTGEIPVDMYETSYIWPVPDAYYAGTPGSGDQPMSIQQMSLADTTSDPPCSRLLNAGDDRRPIPLTPDGGPIAMDRSDASNVGIWACKSVDDLPAVVYPRPPYDTDGSTNYPGYSTKQEFQPHRDQGFYYGAGRATPSANNKPSYMAGRHVATCLFPASDLNDYPYNSVAGNDKSWVMEGSIKTPAKTPPVWRQSGSAHNIGVLSKDILPRVGLRLELDPTSSPPTPPSFGATPCRVPNANGINYDFVIESMQVKGSRFHEDSGNNSMPFDCESVAHRYYGFVIRVKASVDTEDKEMDIVADTTTDDVRQDNLVFVGFEDEPRPISGSDGSDDQDQCHEDPKLIIGQISNMVDDETVNGFDAGMSDGDSIGVLNKLTATGDDLPTLLPGEWHDLQVRVHENTLTVFLDNIGPISFEGGFIGNDEAIETISLTDYLGGAEDGNTTDASRARSGLMYFSTRSVQESDALKIHGNDPVKTAWRVGRNSNGFMNKCKITQLVGVTWGSGSNRFSGANISFSWTHQSQTLYAGPYRYILVHDTGSSDNGNDNDCRYVDTFPGGANAEVDVIDSTYDGMADLGAYCHHWGGYGATYTPPTVPLGAPDKFMIDRAGLGGDWVREWAPAYFHNVRWRSFSEQGLPGSTKLTIGVAGGKIVVSGNDAESFSNLEANDTAENKFPTNVARIGGTVMFDRYYLVDGTKYLLINMATRTVLDWAALTTNEEAEDTTEPQIPGGANADEVPKCRLICAWLGRIVISGKADEPNNWFMSAVSDTDGDGQGVGPNDWYFDGSDPAEGLGPIAGNSSNLPEVGDPITTIFPYHDAALVFGCTNSIYALTGDPGPSETTASIQTISKDIGIVSPDAWCNGPNRALYFFGQNGLYQMAPNEFNVDQSNRISAGRLDKTFSSIDASQYNVSLCYDYHTYGVHIFLHPRDEPTSITGTHYYYDERSDSLWLMEYPSNIGPAYAVTYNSLDPERRRVLLGGYDGVIRYFDDLAKEDNQATAIDSFVWIGPIFIDDVTETKLMRIASVLDKTSAAVTYEVYVGETVEEAKASTPVITGTWNKGRNPWRYMRSRGQSIFVKLSSSACAVPWAMETITATIAVAGRARDR